MKTISAVISVMLLGLSVGCRNASKAHERRVVLNQTGGVASVQRCIELIDSGVIDVGTHLDALKSLFGEDGVRLDLDNRKALCVLAPKRGKVGDQEFLSQPKPQWHIEFSFGENWIVREYCIFRSSSK